MTLHTGSLTSLRNKWRDTKIYKTSPNSFVCAGAELALSKIPIINSLEQSITMHIVQLLISGLFNYSASIDQIILSEKPHYFFIFLFG